MSSSAAASGWRPQRQGRQSSPRPSQPSRRSAPSGSSARSGCSPRRSDRRGPFARCPLLCSSRWESAGAGRLPIACDRFTNPTLRSLLAGFLRHTSASIHAPPVVFTTLPGELHHLGILMAAVVAVDAGGHPSSPGRRSPGRRGGRIEDTRMCRDCKEPADAWPWNRPGRARKLPYSPSTGVAPRGPRLRSNGERAPSSEPSRRRSSGRRRAACSSRRRRAGRSRCTCRRSGRWSTG